MRYYTIQNNGILTAETRQALERFYDNILELPEDYEDGKYIVVDGELVLNPNWEEEKKRAERERLDALILTPSDVERALYYSELQMDFEDLKALIKEKAPQIDLKGLAIEFRANNFYRGAVDKDGNRIIDMVGMLLGYTSDDMDYLFENKKLPEKVEPEPEPADTDSDSDTDTDVDTDTDTDNDNIEEMENL